MRNPLSSPLFVPTVTRLAALVLIGAVLVAVVERRNLRALRQTVLFRRVVSWGLMAPPFLIAVFAGGPLALLMVMYLSVQGLRELIGIVKLGRAYGWLLQCSGLMTPLVVAMWPATFPYLPIAFFFGVVGLAVLLGRPHDAFQHAAACLFAFMYVPFTLSTFVVIGRQMHDGTPALLLVAVCVALSDVLAFTTGRLLGRHLLASQLSPNKTVEGALGAIAGAYLALGIMLFVIPASWPGWLTAVLPMLIGCACVWGDLVESLIKRDFGVKDAGSLLPGFGGLLDRIDSLIIAMPVSLLSLRLAGL